MSSLIRRKTLWHLPLILAVTVAASSGFLLAAAASPEQEIARRDRIRADLFAELVKARREMVTMRTDHEAEIRRLDRVRADLFEELARTRRDLAAAREQRETAARDQRPPAEPVGTTQTGSLSAAPGFAPLPLVNEPVSAGVEAAPAPRLAGASPGEISDRSEVTAAAAHHRSASASPDLKPAMPLVPKPRVKDEMKARQRPVVRRATSLGRRVFEREASSGGRLAA